MMAEFVADEYEISDILEEAESWAHLATGMFCVMILENGDKKMFTTSLFPNEIEEIKLKADELYIKERD